MFGVVKSISNNLRHIVCENLVSFTVGPNCVSVYNDKAMNKMRKFCKETCVCVCVLV